MTVANAATLADVLAKKGNKFNARRCTSLLFPGVEFDSQAERDRADWLLSELHAGRITQLLRQPEYVLREKPKRVYTPDFIYLRDGQVVVEDVKGDITEASSLRMAWFRAQYPDHRLLVVKRDRGALSGWTEKEIK